MHRSSCAAQSQYVRPDKAVVQRVRRANETVVRQRAQERGRGAPATVLRRAAGRHGRRAACRGLGERLGVPDGRAQRSRGLPAGGARPRLPVGHADVPGRGGRRARGLSAVRARPRVPVEREHVRVGRAQRPPGMSGVRARGRMSGGRQRRRHGREPRSRELPAVSEAELTFCFKAHLYITSKDVFNNKNI